MKKRIVEYKGCQIHVKPRKLIPIFFRGDEAAFDLIIERDTKQSDLAIPIQVRFPGEQMGLNFKIEVAELLPNKPQVEPNSFYLDYLGTYQIVIPEEEGRVLPLYSFVVQSRGTLFLTLFITVIGAFIGALVAGFIINLLFN